MKTLKESLLDNDFDSHLEDVCQIPMNVLADVLEGFGHKQLLKRHLQRVGAEAYLDMVWDTLQDCEMSYEYISRLTDYEKDIIKEFTNQNPVDPQIVMKVVQNRLHDPLFKDADLAGYSTAHERERWTQEQIKVFFDPVYEKRYYETMLELYFFIENGQGGYIAIRKNAKKENIDILRCILRR